MLYKHLTIVIGKLKEVPAGGIMCRGSLRCYMRQFFTAISNIWAGICAGEHLLPNGMNTWQFNFGGKGYI